MKPIIAVVLMAPFVCMIFAVALVEGGWFITGTLIVFLIGLYLFLS